MRSQWLEVGVGREWSLKGSDWVPPVQDPGCPGACFYVVRKDSEEAGLLPACCGPRASVTAPLSVDS